jgi:hypothetical protein
MSVRHDGHSTRPDESHIIKCAHTCIHHCISYSNHLRNSNRKIILSTSVTDDGQARLQWRAPTRTCRVYRRAVPRATGPHPSLQVSNLRRCRHWTHMILFNIQTLVWAKTSPPPTTLSPPSHSKSLEGVLSYHILNDSEKPRVCSTGRIHTTIKLLLTALQFVMF